MVSDDRVRDQAQGSKADHPDDATAEEADRAVVSTTDPAVAYGQAGDRPPGVRPDETIVAETGQATDSGGYGLPASVGPPGGERPKAGGREDRDNVHRGDGKHGHPEGEGRPARRGWMGYVLTGVVALTCGAGLAWAYMYFSSSKSGNQAKGGDESKESKKDGESSKKGGSDSESTKGDDTSSDGSGATSGGVLGDQVRNLTARFDTLRQRIDAMSMPRDTNSPDLAALRVRMDEFSRSIDEMKELPHRFREMQARQDRLEAETKSRQDRPANEAGRAPPAPNPPVVASPRPEVEPAVIPTPAANPGPAGDALAEGMSLFKKGAYSQAEAVFHGLRQTSPQDARVWYFSALANGLSTGRWEGEARSFVVQGADRERAGLPATSVIDSAFADLSPAAGKEWLASYRKQLLKR